MYFVKEPKQALLRLFDIEEYCKMHQKSMILSVGENMSKNKVLFKPRLVCCIDLGHDRKQIIPFAYIL